MRRTKAADPLFPVEQRVTQAESQLADLREGSSSLTRISAWDDSSPREFIGLASLLAEGSYINFTRPANTPYLVISVQGGLMNVDYVADTSGRGTNTTLAGAVSDAITAAGETGDKTIWLCQSVTESNIDIGGLGPSANITIASHSQQTVVITANTNEDIFKQTSTGGQTSGGLHFRNIGFSIPSSNYAIYNVDTTSEIDILHFKDCNFGGQYIARQDGTDSLNAMGISVLGCTGSLAGFYDVAGASATYSPERLQVYNCVLTLTAFWDGGSTNAAPSRTTISSSRFLLTNGITFPNGKIEQTFSDLYIRFAAASAIFTTAAASNQIEDLSFTNITVRFSNASGTFCDLGSASTNNNSGLFIDGIYGYMATGVGAGGTFVTVDTDWANVHVGDICGKDFTTQYSGPISGGYMGDTGVFLLLAGRAGGQTPRGGTLAAERLKLRSTASGLAVGRIEFENAVFHAAFGGQYQLDVTNDEPGGYWRLGEGSGNLLDSSGNANTGSPNGGITYSVAGAITGDSDTAITLNGTTGYISVGDAASLDLGDGPFTLEAWIKKAADGVAMPIIAKGQGAYLLQITPANTLQLLRENIAVIVSSTTTITGTDWHHVVATKTGATSHLYIDGADVSGAITNSTMVNTANPLYIGRNVTGAGFFVDGTLDEAAVYPSVLTPARVLQHYNAGNAGRGIVSRFAFASGDFLDYSQTNDYFSLVIDSIEIARFTSGGLVLATVAKSSAYTVAASDVLVIADASGGAFTITLPTAVGIDGKVYRMKKIDSSANAVTIDADGSETIDGGTTATIATQYEAITIVSDGTEWWVL